MTKYTKRQYLADLAANDADAAANKAALDSFAERAEAGEDVASMSEAWNAAHDREYEIEQERFAIEQRWMKRNWTWQDHSFSSLVSANID
jgi:hypothetical protein